MQSMKKLKYRIILKYAGLIVVLSLSIFFIWQNTKKVPTGGDWQAKVAVLSKAEFKGHLVTVKNVRNFTYESGSENNPTIAYYDKTYDLNKLIKVWYVTEPFAPGAAVAHTFLSFEFSTGDFLSITIESRLTKGQSYSALAGMLHTYPLMYIAADERDAVYLRANIRKDPVYLYPVRTTPEHARLLLTDMLQKMNDLEVNPEWYNSLTANCTSMIAYHINKLFPGRLPKFLWQGALTGYADELALKSGLLDTDLSIDQARQKYYISDISRKVGYVKNYSVLIRNTNI